MVVFNADGQFSSEGRQRCAVFLRPVEQGPRALEIPMPKEPINGREPEFSEEDIQREQLGQRGVPGKPDPAKMTPQREKKQPKDVDPGHTA